MLGRLNGELIASITPGARNPCPTFGATVKKSATIIIAGIALTLLAGCSNSFTTTDTQANHGSAPAETTPPGHELLSSTGITKDIAHWTLATDPLLDPYLTAVELEANGRVVKLCMDRHGFTDYPAPRSADMPYADTSPNGISTIFTTATAAKYGYRQAPLPGYTVIDASPQEDPRPGYLEAIQECQDLGLRAVRPQIADQNSHGPSSGTNRTDSSPHERLMVVPVRYAGGRSQRSCAR